MPNRRTRRYVQKQKGGKYGTTRRNHEVYPPGPRQCHPNVGDRRPAYGCLPGHELLKLNTRILGDTSLQGGNRSPKDLVKLREELAKKLNVKPEDEASFIDALPIDAAEKQRLKKQYLRPRQPESWKSDPDMWLDSNNIRDVMTQYEEQRKDFEFMGPFPIDFAAPDPYEGGGGGKEKCLIGEMCSLDIKGLRAKGKTKVGIIYNLDPHYKNGSHWVANYVDLTKNRCYYFDSYGMEVPGQIQKFMQWLTLQEPKMKLAYNARRFQFKGSECGMYSMYFIIRMLMGELFRPFCRRAPRDGAMLTLRSWLFSK
jgi:hypothetical protein